jgi:hypothetical protein
VGNLLSQVTKPRTCLAGHHEVYKRIQPTPFDNFWSFMFSHESSDASLVEWCASTVLLGWCAPRPIVSSECCAGPYQDIAAINICFQPPLKILSYLENRIPPVVILQLVLVKIHPLKKIDLGSAPKCWMRVGTTIFCRNHRFTRSVTSFISDPYFSSHSFSHSQLNLEEFSLKERDYLVNAPQSSLEAQ